MTGQALVLNTAARTNWPRSMFFFVDILGLCAGLTGLRLFTCGNGFYKALDFDVQHVGRCRFCLRLT